jgi:hypothetical protein
MGIHNWSLCLHSVWRLHYQNWCSVQVTESFIVHYSISYIFSSVFCQTLCDFVWRFMKIVHDGRYLICSKKPSIFFKKWSRLFSFSSFSVCPPRPHMISILCNLTDKKSPVCSIFLFSFWCLPVPDCTTLLSFTALVCFLEILILMPFSVFVSCPCLIHDHNIFMT